MTRIRGGALAILAFVALIAVSGTAVAQEEEAGASLTGCAGRANSTDEDGPLHSVVAPGGGGASQDRPFVLDYDGRVSYRGQSRGVIKNHSWVIRLYGIPIKTGGSENDENKRTTQGDEPVSNYVPFRITGLYFINGSISGEGGSCAGAVWVKLQGNPVGTIPWLFGIALAVGGAALTWASRPVVGAAAASAAAPTDTPPPPSSPPAP